MKILITGATGNVGTHLVKSLGGKNLKLTDMLYVSERSKEADLVKQGVKTRITGTNTGSLSGAAATSKPVSFSAIDAFDIIDGKIVNLWHIEQIDKMKQQLTR